MKFKYFGTLFLCFFNCLGMKTEREDIFQFMNFIQEIPEEQYFDLLKKQNQIIQQKKECVNFKRTLNPFKFAVELKMAANNNLYEWIYHHYKNNPFKVNIEWMPGKNYLHSEHVLDDPFLVALLIILGIDINKQCGKGYTPLILACRQQKWKTCEALLTAGANVDVKDKFNKNAFIYAMFNNAPDHIIKVIAARSLHLLDSLQYLCSDNHRRILIEKSFKFVQQNYPKLTFFLKKFCSDQQIRNKDFFCHLCEDENCDVTMTDCCYNFICVRCLQKFLIKNNYCPYCRKYKITNY